MKQAVSKLVDIAKYHQFEGWLINIENKIDAEKVCRSVHHKHVLQHLGIRMDTNFLINVVIV